MSSAGSGNLEVMTDPTLRLPSSTFRAVLDLGKLPLEAPPLPESLAHPDLDLELDEEEGIAAFYIEYPNGKLHVEVGEDHLEYHFHDARDAVGDTSPWPANDTEALIEWTLRYVAHVMTLLADLITDVEEAADWCDSGLPVFTRNHEPKPLEIVEVHVEGDLLMLPWLGSGHIDHAHLDELNNPIVLLWNPTDAEADRELVRAWRDPETGKPVSAAHAGVDWNEVGLPEAEVSSWFDSFYQNHEVKEDPADLLLRASLNRIAGLG